MDNSGELKGSFNQTTNASVTKLNEIKQELNAMEIETEKMGDFLKGMRLRPIPVDIPNALTTTEWLLELTKSVNTCLEGYETFDETSKKAFTDFTAEITTLVGILQTKYGEMVDLYTAIDGREFSYQSNLSAMRGEINAIKERVDNLALSGGESTVDDDFITSLNHLIVDYYTFKKDYDMWRGTWVTSVNNKLSDLQVYLDKLTELQGTVSGLENDIENLANEMGTISDNIGGGLVGQVNALEKAQSSLKVALDNSKSDTEKLAKTIETVQYHQDALENNVEQWIQQQKFDEDTIKSIQKINTDLQTKTQQHEQNIQMWKAQTETNQELALRALRNQQNIIQNARSFMGTLYISSKGCDALGECLLRVNPDNKGEYINTYTEVFGDSGIGGLSFPTMTEIMKVCQFVFTINSVGLCRFTLEQPFGSIDSGEKSNRGNYFKLSSGYHDIRFTHYETEDGVCIPFHPSNDDVLVLCRVKDERVANQSVDLGRIIAAGNGGTTDRQMTSRRSTQRADFVAASYNPTNSDTWEINTRVYIPYEDDICNYSYYFMMLRSSTECVFKVQIDEREV